MSYFVGMNPAIAHPRIETESDSSTANWYQQTVFLCFAKHTCGEGDTLVYVHVCVDECTPSFM